MLGEDCERGGGESWEKTGLSAVGALRYPHNSLEVALKHVYSRVCDLLGHAAHDALRCGAAFLLSKIN